LIDGPETNKENKIAKGDDDKGCNTREKYGGLAPVEGISVTWYPKWALTNIFNGSKSVVFLIQREGKLTNAEGDALNNAVVRELFQGL